MICSFRIPLTVAVDVRQPLILAGVLGIGPRFNPGGPAGEVTWGPIEPAYRGVSLVRIQARPDGKAAKLLDEVPGGREGKGKKSFSPSLYYAMIDGAFYLSLTEGGSPRPRSTLPSPGARARSRRKRGN